MGERKPIGRRVGACSGPLVLALALATPLAAPARAAALTPLKEGIEASSRTGALQKALGLEPDRIFGPSTTRAVKRFQRRRGLRADGVVGPATWALIKRVRARQRAKERPRRTARPRVRSRGSAVARLQRALGLVDDGVFGSQTTRAVRRFQRRHDLTADGIVGPATWDALGHPGVETVLRPVYRRPRLTVAGVPIALLRVVDAANRIARKPYKYGGGHARWNDSGYDCSGSVSYALHGGGLLGRSRTSGGFSTWGAAGRGRYITVYASPGHVFMVVNGARFDTSGRTGTGSRWQRDMRNTSGYVARHPPGL